MGRGRVAPDWTGKKFNRWTVLSRAENSVAGQIRWLCRCDCGADGVVQSAALKNNHSKSCGCLKVETVIKRSTKHGHSSSTKTTGTYHSWAGMIARCTNPQHVSYPNYGGRGITVCRRWLKFKNFLADMGEKPNGYSIERRNFKKCYSAKNCEWATTKAQARNKSNNRFVTANGATRTIAEWCEVTGIHRATVSDRVERNWPIERAVTTPPRITRR